MDEHGQIGYGEVLHALGTLCDDGGWRNVRIVECAEGLILQYSVGAGAQPLTTYLYTLDDLRALSREASAQPPALARPTPSSAR